MELSSIERDLLEVVGKNPGFGGKTLVLSQTENSDLLPVSKECSKDFFRRVFSDSGPLWNMYEETKLGDRPVGCEYLSFLAGRMYFLKNVEKRFMRSPGAETIFEFREGKITQKRQLSVKNALLVIQSPLEALSQALDISLLPLYIDAKMKEFLAFRGSAMRFYSEHKGSATHPLELAQTSLLGAVEAMHYSFASSLAAAFGVRLRDLEIWRECEAEKLYELLVGGKADLASSEFGFHSASPYDISTARFSEDLLYAKRKPEPFPKDKYARWRENAKFLCSRYLDLMRDSYIALGEEAALGGLIFHLSTSELSDALQDPRKWKPIAMRREAEFDKQAKLSLPYILVYSKGEWAELKENAEGMAGIPAGAEKDAQGPAVFINEAADYRKDVAGKIIVSKTFSPNLASLLGGSLGLLSASGGVLAHSAIIAREMGLPCIVQAKNISAIKEGQTISIQGKTGRASIPGK